MRFLRENHRKQVSSSPLNHTCRAARLEAITLNLRKPASELIAEPEALLAWLNHAERDYQDLPRHRIQAEDIVALKLRYILKRYTILTQLLRHPPAWTDTCREELAEILLILNTYLLPHQQEQAAHLLSRYGYARVMANQGVTPAAFPDLLETAGPGVNLNMVANRSSNWSFDRWKGNKLFARYQFEQEGVRYRGVSFRPGDVLLANVNLDGNGLYTCLSEPGSFSSHAAFFALLEDDGRYFPVAVETYEKGVRPVPLNVFLGPSYSSYVEIYRHRDYATSCAAAINAAAAEFIHSVKGYNFDSEDQDPSYMSCTAVGRFLHQRAGLSPAQTRSRIGHPNIKRNLSKLGYTFFDFFAPVDYLLNECFRCIGRIDNNQVDRLLAREVTDREFRHRFMTRELDPAKFPFPYELNRWGVRQMRRQTFSGRLICRLEGFEPHNLPRGPDDLLAVIRLAEKQIGAVIRKTRRAIQQMIDESDDPDLTDFLSDSNLKDFVDNTLQLPWLPKA